MEVHEEKKQYVYKYVKICSYFHEGKEQYVYKPVKMEVHKGKKENNCLVAPNFFRQSPNKHSTTTLLEIHDRGVGRSENLEVGGAPSEPSVPLPLSMPVIYYGEKQHKCSECSSSFPTKNNLNRHISMDHERKKKHIASVQERKKPFNCEICDYSCTQKTDMTQHVSSVHEKKKPFKCDIYNYSCFLKHDIKKHLESVHEEKKSFKCDIQNEKKRIQTKSSNNGDAKESNNQLIQCFWKKQILLFYLAGGKVAGGTPSPLPVQPPLPMSEIYDVEKQHQCSEYFSSLPTHNNLNRHIVSDHEEKKKLIASVHEGKKPFKCEICDFRCNQKAKMTQHVLSVHQKKRLFKCNFCDYMFSRNSHLNKHIESVHEKNNPFECDICDYISYRESHLKKHLESVHERNKLFKCDICDHISYRKSHLKNHITSVHEKKKQFRCEICVYSCKIKANMIHHALLVHKKKEPFKCDFCDYSCAQKGSMTKHVETTHERKKKPFNCNTCKKFFQRKDKFEKHVNIDHKGKWFPCQLCKAHFGFKTLLIEHGMSKHDLKGPFSCNICQKTFSTSGERKKHQLRCKDPSKYPFVCRICHGRFASKKSASVHEKNKNIHPSPDRACVSTGASGTSKLV